MYSIHWPKFGYEKDRHERPLNTFEKEERHIKVDYAVIAILYLIAVMVVWGVVIL